MNELKSGSTEKERLYFADWLRVLTVLSLIPYHSALSYTGLGDVYIINPLKGPGVLPFLFLTAPLDNFFMTLLFFVSGISACHALKRRSKTEFVTERRNKLLIPLLLGFLFLCPAQAYFQALYEGYSGGFLAFLPKFYFTNTFHYHGYAHLWFLLYLFVFSWVFAPLFVRWQKGEARYNKMVSFLLRGNNLLLPLAFIVIAESGLRPFVDGPYIIFGDWANDIVYASFFLFGFVFASSPAIQTKIFKWQKPFGIIALLCACALIFMYYLWAVLKANSIWLSVSWAFTKGVYECAAILFLSGFAKKHWNKKTRLIQYLSKASFAYYIWHYIPVSALTYLFLRTGLTANVKYLLTVLLSFLFIFAFYEGIVKRLYPAARCWLGRESAAGEKEENKSSQSL